MEQRDSQEIKEKEERICTVEQFVRRSTRDPNAGLLGKSEVVYLLQKIKRNHKDTIILKLKDHLKADINIAVVDSIITALWKNNVCQALYIQNISNAMTDAQVIALIDLLKSKMIWCLNIGENYEVSLNTWKYFCKSLKDTNVICSLLN